MSTEQFHPIGGLVTIDEAYRGKKLPAGAVYRVVDVPRGRRTTYLIENVENGGRIKALGHQLAEYTGEAPAMPAPLPPLVVGAVVTVEPGGKIPAVSPMVVLSTNAVGDVSLVRLGGDDNRCWRGVSRRLLTEITLAELAELLTR